MIHSEASMPTWGWVCIGLSVLAIALVVFAIIDKGVQKRRYEREADEVIGWVVSADPELLTPIGQNRHVQVLVSLEGQTVRDFAVARLALRIAELKHREPENGEETALAKVVRSREYE